MLCALCFVMTNTGGMGLSEYLVEFKAFWLFNHGPFAGNDFATEGLKLICMAFESIAMFNHAFLKLRKILLQIRLLQLPGVQTALPSLDLIKPALVIGLHVLNGSLSHDSSPVVIDGARRLGSPSMAKKKAPSAKAAGRSSP